MQNEIEKNIAAGLTPQDARYAALRSFGGIDQTKESCRDLFKIRFLDTFMQHVSYALRTMTRNPSFSGLVILTLSLGLGANNMIFSLVNAAFLRPLPFRTAERLVVISETSEDSQRGRLSYPEFLDLKAWNQSFEEVVAIWSSGFALTVGSTTEMIYGEKVSEGFLRTLGVQPFLGRDFLPEEHSPAGVPVLILSHRAWQKHFGERRNIVGQTVQLDEVSYTIVGVLPASFKSPEEFATDVTLVGTHPMDLLTPLKIQPEHNRRRTWLLKVLGRPKVGVSNDQAKADLTVVARRLEEQYPESNAGKGLTLTLLYKWLRAESESLILLLWSAAGIILAIACANVANLLLSRTVERRKEIAVRAALGASRRRVISQLLTEALLLAFPAGLVGLSLATWGNRVLTSFAQEADLRIPPLELDLRVFAFSLILSTAVGVLAGLAPAARLAKVDINEALKEGSRVLTAGRTRRLMYSALVAVQVALSFVLLVSGGLLVNSYMRLSSLDPGFRPERVLAVAITSSSRRIDAKERWRSFWQQTLDRLNSLTAIETAGITDTLPLGGSNISYSFEIEGRSGVAAETGMRRVSWQYFKAMGITLRRGRFFTHQDSQGASEVVIINDALARKYWGEQDPLGARLQIASASRRIVGVVGGIRHSRLEKEPDLEVYLPYPQVNIGGATLVVRSVGNPLGLIPMIKNEISLADPTYFASSILPLEKVVWRTEAARQLTTSVISLFAIFALFIANSGVYSVIAYATSQRTHEIGIRMALGAGRGEVLRLVLDQGVRLGLAGLGMGVAAAYATTHVLKSSLYGVTATDGTTFLSVALLLAVAVVFASYVPARAATSNTRLSKY